MDTKAAFHELIDQIPDPKRLEAYYDLIRRLNLSESGKLWASLSASEQEELLLSYDESLNPENLVDHEEIRKRNAGWLRSCGSTETA
jgi:hypothetical protein